MKNLRYFKALARHRHFGRAADACAISQPALSVQIRELEETLGAKLVERGSRRVTLTALGQVMAARADVILKGVDELLDTARAANDPFAGSLRLGVIPTVAPYMLPAIIKNVTRHYPALEFRPREAVTRKLLEDVLDGRLDAAILALPVFEPSLKSIILLEEEFVLVRPRAQAGRPVPDARKLREMKLLLLEEGHCFRDQALSYCKASSSSGRDIVEGVNLSTLVQMVAAGLGVTLVPQMAVTAEGRANDVSIARLPAPRPTRKIGMVWRKSSPLSAQLARIAEIIKKPA